MSHLPSLSFGFTWPDRAHPQGYGCYQAQAVGVLAAMALPLVTVRSWTGHKSSQKGRWLILYASTSSVLVMGQLCILSPWGLSRTWICHDCQYFSTMKNQSLWVLPLRVRGSWGKAHRGGLVHWLCQERQELRGCFTLCDCSSWVVTPSPSILKYRNHSLYLETSWS